MTVGLALTELTGELFKEHRRLQLKNGEAKPGTMPSPELLCTFGERYRMESAEPAYKTAIVSWVCTNFLPDEPVRSKP